MHCDDPSPIVAEEFTRPGTEGSGQEGVSFCYENSDLCLIPTFLILCFSFGKIVFTDSKRKMKMSTLLVSL